MAKKRTGGEQQPSPLTSVLAAACCSVLVIIALWAPFVRAQLILSTLPGLSLLAAAWFRKGRRK
jgi:hypothetical protein